MKSALDNILAHPMVWRAHQSPHSAVHDPIPSGFDQLDRYLNGGWPRGALTEISTSQTGIGTVQLLLPALARLSQKQWIIWINPPYRPYAPGLAAQGISLAHLIIIQTHSQREQLWAMEQALQSGACKAMFSWVGKLPIATLRRLQLAAHASHCWGLLFSGTPHTHTGSPCALRIHLAAANAGIQVHIVKRRNGWPIPPFTLLWEHAQREPTD